jgi:hypothetical protein
MQRVGNTTFGIDFCIIFVLGFDPDLPLSLLVEDVRKSPGNEEIISFSAATEVAQFPSVHKGVR